MIAKYVERLLARAVMTAAVALDTIETAIADIESGRPVVVIDDEDRENEGDLDLRRRARDPRTAWRSWSATCSGLHLRAP